MRPPAHRFPKNLTAGLLAGVLGGVAAGVAHPDETKAFYGAAVQVVPVFLVAVALERTLGEVLGTETSALDEELARVEREWTPPSSMTRAYYGVGLKLRDNAPMDVSSTRIHEARIWLDGLSPLAVASNLVSEENLNDVQFLDLVAKLTALETRELEIPSGAVTLTSEQLLEQWENVNGTLVDAAKARASDEVRFTVSSAYRVRRHQQRLSVVVSVVGLAIAEALAFVGLLSPGATYAGLFVLTAGAAAASFVAVTVDAVVNLLTPDVDIQSAGLSWPADVGTSSGSHWDAL